MNQEDKFNRVLSYLQDAAFNDKRWPAASALIDDLCGTRGNALVVGRGESRGTRQILFARFCYRGERQEERERWYFDNYFRRDQRIPRLVRLLDGCLVHMRDLYTKRELRTSRAYNEALALGGYQNGLNVRLDGPDGSHIVWTLADTTEAGGWGSDQTMMIQRLLPHVRQFVRARHALAKAESWQASVVDLLDYTKAGVIHLDRWGKLVAVNDRARSILQCGSGLQEQEGFLQAVHAADSAALERLLAGALPAYGGRAVSGSMTIEGSPLLPRLVVHVNPMVARQRHFGARGVAAFVLVLDASCRPKLDVALVEAAFGLTTAESEVAVGLTEGRATHDIAFSTGRKESTVKWHVKKALRRLGVPRQSDLVRLLLTTPGLSRPQR